MPNQQIMPPGEIPKVARIFAPLIPKLRKQAIFSPTIWRTRSAQTAKYIGEQIGLQPTALADVFERKGLFDIDENGNQSGIAGPGRNYFEQRFPDLKLPDELTETGWWNRPVETDNEFFERVESSIESLVLQHGNTNHSVALVVHGDYLDQSINYLMNVPRKTENYQTPWVANWVFHNTSVSRIDIHGSARNVIYLNKIDHLPTEYITW